MIRTEMDSMPTEMDELNRKIIQQEIAQAALKKEEDKLSHERLETVTKELAQLREKFNSMKAQWDNERPPSPRSRSCVRKSKRWAERSSVPSANMI